MGVNVKPLRWSDVWLLVSAYLSFKKGDSSLRSIIAVADTINHAVANYEELSSAMVRLEESGYVYVERNPWRMICTDKGVGLVEPVANKNSVAFRIWKELEKRLGVPAWDPAEPLPHPENNLYFDGFSKSEYENEVESYLAMIHSSKS